jgi:hypothetical protein
LVTKTTTSIGYIENADTLDTTRQAFCQCPTDTTGRDDPLTYTTPFAVFSALLTTGGVENMITRT